MIVQPSRRGFGVIVYRGLNASLKHCIYVYCLPGLVGAHLRE